MAKADFQIQTLTPFWTGGAKGKMDRLHETGLLGSLRWWYEVIVRGVGYHVSDPTGQPAQFDTKNYTEAQRGSSSKEALSEGLKTLCPVSYLFGATGWGRLFRLDVISSESRRIDFYSALASNRNWLNDIFPDRSCSFGTVCLRMTDRGHDIDYALGQLTMIFHFAQDYGSLGGRPQYGFGQFKVTKWPVSTGDLSLQQGLQALSHKSSEMKWTRQSSVSNTAYNLRNFFSIDFQVLKTDLSRILYNNPDQLGSGKGLLSFIPCVFDLRYKGNKTKNVGFRRWLEKHLTKDDINRLMGPSGHEVSDNDRTAGLVYFGMPYLISANSYLLRVFGYCPPDFQVKGKMTPKALAELCEEYIKTIMGGDRMGELKLGETLIKGTSIITGIN